MDDNAFSDQISECGILLICMIFIAVIKYIESVE